MAILLQGCQTNTATTSPGTVTPPPGSDRIAVSEVAANAAEDQLKPLLYWTVTDAPEEILRVDDHKGRAGQALRFDGQSQALAVPIDINPEKMPQVTMAVWVRYTGEEPAEGINSVLSHDDGGFDRTLGIDNRGESVGWSAFAGSQSVLGGIPVRPGEWTFLAGTYDQQAGVVQLFVDETKLRVEDAELGDGYQELTLGANPGFGEHFPGDLGHLQIFDRVLSDAEIAELRSR